LGAHAPLLALEGRHLSLDPRDPAFFTDPYPVYAALHAQAPAFCWKDYGFWCFAGFDNVNALLRDRRFGRQILHVATRDELGLPEPASHLAEFDAVEAHSLLELEPPVHTRLRTLVNRAFVSRHVDRLRPEIAALCHQLIDGFEGNGEAELLSAYAEIIPATVIARMLGVPDDRVPDLLDWSHRMVRMYMFGRDRAAEDDANTAARDFAAYLRGLVGERRNDPRDDLISHMIAAEQDGGAARLGYRHGILALADHVQAHHDQQEQVHGQPAYDEFQPGKLHVEHLSSLRKADELILIKTIRS